MNTQNFNQSGGFPLETEVFADMQTAYSIFNNLGSIAGNFSIISGCEETNGFVSNGVVFINGEVLEFRGGNVSSTVIIVENRIKKEFENGEEKEVLFVRYATFGIGSVTFYWSDFKRPKSTGQLTKDKAEQTELEKLIERVKQLEARPKANVPIGMIAIWDRPANEIPAGWIEYQPLRGRMPIGLDPIYDTNVNGDLKNYNLQTLGYGGGVREHKLLQDELPNYKLKYDTSYDTPAGGREHTWSSAPGSSHTMYINSGGGDKPHNNMSPYRVVYFIQYKGV
ncbi:hypothetical protein BWK60_03395 [Flavobacterium covae]|nr:hypothetical protein BWK60_03395 [Flavobacterium covae]